MNAPRLELRPKASLGQSMVMTQALQQSIKLLQANALELREYVEQALEENPFLSQEEADAENSGDTSETSEKDDDGEPKEADFIEDGVADFSGAESWADGDAETNYLRYEQGTGGGAADYNAEDDTRTIDDNPAHDISLREHLLNQLQLEITEPARRVIGAHLIDLVDEAGYIKEDFTPLCEVFGVERAEIEAVLSILQTFDPVGVCARTLQGCLALQLREKNRLDPAMEKLLANLPLLADSRFDELQKKCGVDKEDLRQMVAEIRALNPKPASGFSHEISQTLEPDVFVHRLPDGNWHIELNMGNFPRVMVNKRFYKKVNSETKNKKDKEFFAEKFGHANWLVRALEQRAETMLKVVGEIIKQQDAFFRLGVRYLKPMTLKDIAALTGYHESTISRVTSGKYLQCHSGAMGGTLELKYFFTSALISSITGGGDVSSESVKHYIRELIEREELDNVLQDEQIAELLKERSINVARRTVAKYREAIGIPPSSKRKRIKQGAM